MQHLEAWLCRWTDASTVCGITNRIEKIHQTGESDSAKSHNVYSLAIKAQHRTTQCVQGAQTKEAGIRFTSLIWVM